VRLVFPVLVAEATDDRQPEGRTAGDEHNASPQYRQDCRVTVTLRRPSTEEYGTWSVAQRAAYIDEIVSSGDTSREAAEKQARRDDAEALPDGLATPGQLIVRVEADERRCTLLRRRRDGTVSTPWH
jgi:hypothetical protein